MTQIGLFQQPGYVWAMTSISTSAPAGSFATWTVERAGGCSPPRALVDLVHLGKIFHPREEHRGLDHPVESAAAAFKDGLEVGEGLLRLLADG